MLSIEMAVGLLVGIAVVLGVIWFIFLRKTRFAYAGFVVFGGLAVFVYFVGLAHVYILDDELEGRYEEKIALFTSEFTFKDGSTAMVEPLFNVQTYSVIVNNTDERHTYSVAVYSSSSSRFKC